MKKIIINKKKINLKIFKSKAFWLLAIFWIFVGAASSSFYNMQTLITQVWFRDTNIFKSGTTVSKTANTLGATIIGGAGLVSALIGGPLAGFLIDKFKSYKKTIGIFLCAFILVNLIIFSFITPKFIGKNPSLLLGLLIGIVTPITGICYGYRNPIDAYSTLYAEDKKLPMGFVAGIYSIGFGIAGYGINYLIQWYSDGLNDKNTHNYYIFFYLIYAGLLAILLIYMILFMSEPKWKVSKNSSNQQKKEEIINNKKEKKLLFKNRNWWLGLIAFAIIIGFYTAIDIFYINILPKRAPIDDEGLFTRSAQHGWDSRIILDVKGLFDLIRGPIMAISFMVSALIVKKIGIKKSMFLAAIIGMITILSIGFSIYGGKYIKWVIILVPSFMVPIMGSLIVTASFKFSQNMTTRGIRATIMTIFNGLTYGIGGLMYGLVGPLIFDSLGGLEKWSTNDFTKIDKNGAILEVIKDQPAGVLGKDYVIGHYYSGNGWITFIIMAGIIFLSLIFITLLSKDMKTKAVMKYEKNKNN